jgi:beta-fructofuranosidase
MSLPRLLSVTPDNDVWVEPVPELHVLRGKHAHVGPFEVVDSGRQPDGTIKMLDKIKGDCLELIVRLRPSNADEFGLVVCCAPDMSEFTQITVQHSEKKIKMSNCSGRDDPGAGSRRQRGNDEIPCSLDEHNEIILHVFVDRSIIEVFVNGQASLTWRVYPVDARNNGVGIVARQGRIAVSAVDAWMVQA